MNRIRFDSIMRWSDMRDINVCLFETAAIVKAMKLITQIIMGYCHNVVALKVNDRKQVKEKLGYCGGTTQNQLS